VDVRETLLLKAATEVQGNDVVVAEAPVLDSVPVSVQTLRLERVPGRKPRRGNRDENERDQPPP